MTVRNVFSTSNIKKGSAWLGALGALWLSFVYLIQPAVDAHIDSKIEQHYDRLKDEADSQISFRTLISREVQIPEDRIHIVFGQMYYELIDFKTKLYIIDSRIQKEMNEISIGIVYYNGREWWRHNNTEDYRIRRKQDSTRYWIDDNNQTHIINIE